MEIPKIQLQIDKAILDGKFEVIYTPKRYHPEVCKDLCEMLKTEGYKVTMCSVLDVMLIGDVVVKDPTQFRSSGKLRDNYLHLFQMKILTYANKDKRELQNLLKSLTSNGFEGVVVGMGEKWHGVINKTKGYHRKLNELSDENEVVALVDGYDVLVCGSPKEVLEKYRKISDGHKIVFCGERMCAKWVNCRPLNKWWGQKKRPPTQYLNSGIIVGKVKNLRELFQYMLDSKIKDDQLAATNYTENNIDSVAIDSSHELVATVTGMDFLDFDAKDGRLINTRTGTKPCLIHIPGSGFDLNYRIDWIGKRVLEGYQPDPHSYPKRLCGYLRRNWWVVVLLILVGGLSAAGIYYYTYTTTVVWVIFIIALLTYLRCFF